ncbi:16S rRNA (cytosine(967)-C(5))-methyltransferase RsmB [Cytobacillus sp. S13-E01]|uniref:16S rRNA (cytosine(967)-C(5))-methyltransferase RsmB n=1 Tax=Cytobacillus sp. S13-E01 TaxID=3031326 RepID=UPI0023D8322B|nr:16S rRNA (cytosine(967)-C(5))-methyltransferase RsmB [Cytobacillus sp. S13-E01]MDF0725235.1 16S rRNA (cytosine(967)-C(5))-methyltransferase RsmB [Cytobacillus sp. S13-E01]
MSKHNVRETALDILVSIEKNQSYSNLLLNKMIEKNNIKGKDIGLLTEMVYGSIQQRDLLDFYVEPFLKNKKKIELWVSILIRLSVYQMLFLDRVPERAIFFEAVEIAKKRGHKGISSMVNGVLRTIQREGVPSLNEILDPTKRLAIETSHPEWLVKRWVEQLGYEETKKMCEINLKPPVQTARVNISRTTVDELLQQLENDGYSVSKGDLSLDSIKSTSGNLVHSTAFKQGLLTIQDESSMLVARALGVSINEKVLDSCAAPGGKTTHIAELLNNTGQVISLDLHEHKVRLIDQQVERLQLSNVTTKALDSRKVKEHFVEESFDKILVDAPCSGFGVIRRKPDIKFAKKESDIENLARIQLSILQAVSPLLKKGGILVYSTCTIDREENTDIIEKFLSENKDFSYDHSIKERLPERVQPYIEDGQIQIFPQYFETDGFYIASLKKQV